MYKKLISAIKPFFKSVLIVGLVLTLTLGNAHDALALRSGGRIGGGSFRAPSRTFTPSRPSVPPGGGYGYPGGGFGFPFLFPFFGFPMVGFGGLFSVLILFAIANFLVQSFRRAGGDEELSYSSNPSVSIAEVQVGLLAEARTLQADLDRMAQTADTGSEEGRAQVLQEATLALLRHPEYWVYASSQTQQARLEAAEAKFNQLALAERSKFTEETLSNVNNRLQQADKLASLPEAEGPGGELVANGPSEYIVVTLLAATLGKMDLPEVNNSQDLRRALSQIGGLASDRLLAIEILWAPQESNDTLTSDDLLAEYPNLKLV
ncbi:DUF1517 domain-containing protein [Kamptonema cortianum]|nr:DUF1517 domain-containing protein [Desertifilum sp.]MDK3159313.1 DUF1517 domain-containing protein [Kamptonema cortianum]